MVWLKRSMKVLLPLAVIWLIANLGYRWVIQYRLRAREQAIPWDHAGVHPAAAEISIVQEDHQRVMLLVHGINDTPEVWNRFAPALAQEGFSVQTVRLPGFGERVSEYAKYSRNDWIEKVAETLRQLQTRFTDITLVGHSLGGAVSIGVVHKYPDLADRLVLLTPGIAVANDRSPLLPVRTWHSIGGVIAPLVECTEYPFGPDALDKECIAMASRTTFVPLKVVGELFQLMDENFSAAPEIKAPTLMILAEEDHVVDNTAARQWHALLGSEEKPLLELEQTAHLIQRDFRWQDVVRQIAHWADELSQKAEVASQ